MAESVEIERKYLLAFRPPFTNTVSPMVITQGWLPGEVIKERIRESVYPDGHAHYMRAIKMGKGISRFEFEEPMTPTLFNAMWPFTEGKRVLKRRFRVPEGKLVWEIDEFAGRNLILAEIELKSENQKFKVPEWLAPAVVKEVTDDSRYSNQRLAR